MPTRDGLQSPLKQFVTDDSGNKESFGEEAVKHCVAFCKCALEANAALATAHSEMSREHMTNTVTVKRVWLEHEMQEALKCASVHNDADATEELRRKDPSQIHPNSPAVPSATRLMTGDTVRAEY